MGSSQSMRCVRKFERRRVLVAVYDSRTAPRWFWSKCWAGRWDSRGVLSAGVGFQLRLGRRVVELLVWPRREATWGRFRASNG